MSYCIFILCCYFESLKSLVKGALFYSNSWYMARKISEMPELTSLESNDYLPIVDADAITANQNKRVTIATLNALFGGSSLAFVGENATSVTISGSIIQTVLLQPNVVIGTDTSIGSGLSGVVLLGSSAEVAKVDGIAIGTNSSSTETGALALGISAEATGQYTIAIGDSITVSGVKSVGIGGATTADYAVAVGHSSSVTGQNSIAIGYGATATAIDECVIGNSDLSVVRFDGGVEVYASGFNVGHYQSGTQRRVYESGGQYHVGSSSYPFTSMHTVSMQVKHIYDSYNMVGAVGDFLIYDTEGVGWHTFLGTNGIDITTEPDTIGINESATIALAGINYKANDICIGSTKSTAYVKIGATSNTPVADGISIGNNIDNTNQYSIAIGSSATTNNNNECRIGSNHQTKGITAVYLGNGDATVYAANVPQRRAVARLRGITSDIDIDNSNGFFSIIRSGSGVIDFIFTTAFADASFITMTTFQSVNTPLLRPIVTNQTTTDIQITIYNNADAATDLAVGDYLNVLCESIN
jgi:hypothetical protein